MRRFWQTFIFIACVFFTVSAAYNVMADNLEVEQMAAVVACGEQGANCRAQKAMMSRTPFAQVFEYVTPKRTVGVRCTRAFVMVGDYTCTLR